MGRPYKQELEAIYDTYHHAESFDISALISFFANNCDRPLFIVGSGGSYAAAKGFELCYQSYGGFAKTVTPYELQNEKYVIGKSKVLIITAGGNNPDTVGVYNYVRLYEPFEICVLCMSEKSRLSKLVHENRDAILYERSTSFGKDGYLAVNSSVAMLTIAKKLMDPLENSAGKHLVINQLAAERDYIYGALKKCTNIVVLYGGWGTPAAVDLESKCSEAGLISVQYVDYRNFAHGRHNWMDKMQGKTAIVAITTPEDQVIRNKTLDKLPMEIPRIFLTTSKRGSLGSLELLIQVFYFVDILGDLCKIDPGRPQVPEYGSQIYHIKYNLKTQDKYLKSILKHQKNYSIYRKTKEIQDCGWYDYCSEMYDTFISGLSSEKYGALLLDIDGTIMDEWNCNISDSVIEKLNELLAHGVAVGFATGRGDSITEVLRSAIKKEFWNKVFIGFYNGSVINTMEEGYDPKEEKSEKLTAFSKLLEQQLPWLFGKLKIKDYQISIREKDEKKLNFYFELLSEMKLYYEYGGVQICKSGHALDIIEKGCGKQRLVNYIRKIQPYNLLCIGDEGKIYENDFEFLLVNHGLSVDHQNFLGNSGWNLAPAGCKKVKAVEYYLKKVEIEDGYFSIQGL